MTEGSLIQTAYELGRAERKAIRRRKREVRKCLVKADGESRPVLFWSAVNKVRREHKEETNEAKERARQRAQSIVEKFFTCVACAALLAVVVVVVGDITVPQEDDRSIVFGSIPAGVAVAAVGMFFLVVLMLDIASYRPRLFAQCLGRPDDFFQSLADLSPELDTHVDQIANERPRSWQRVKELEQELLAESTEFILPDGVRTRIILRVSQRLAGLLAGLALFGYGLSAATNGGLLRDCAGAAKCGQNQSAETLPEHIYFSLVSFFNGFSDLQLVQDIAGYSYLLVIVASFVAVIYFFLTDIVASQNEFRANMRAAAESYVLQQSDALGER